MDLHSWLQGGFWSQDEIAHPSALQRDEQANNASSIVWTDHSDGLSDYFEKEDQNPLPDHVISWEATWEASYGHIFSTKPQLPPVRYVFTPSLAAYQLLTFIQAIWSN
jgi:hypothetical protein